MKKKELSSECPIVKCDGCFLIQQSNKINKWYEQRLIKVKNQQ